MKAWQIMIFVIILAAAGIGFFWLWKKEPPSLAVPTPTPSRFISSADIVSSDTIIRITKEGFVPSELTIKKGARVVWVNESGNFVWPASDLHPTHQVYPEFDPLEPIKTGEAWPMVFEKVGKWNFHDHLKPSWRGALYVVDK